MMESPTTLDIGDIVALDVQHAPFRGMWEVKSKPIPDPSTPEWRVVFEAQYIPCFGERGIVSTISLPINREVYVSEAA